MRLRATVRKAPSYIGLKPASAAATRAAKGASAKRNTKPELKLRRALWALGLRYRVDVAKLPGRPDIAFSSVRVAVFCDGDFWHGRHLEERIGKLSRGHNAPYWIAKIQSNVKRDGRTNLLLRRRGWVVMRYWETDVAKSPETLAAKIELVVRTRRARCIEIDLRRG